MKAPTLFLIAVALLACSVPVQAGPIPTTPIYTNKLRFRIPFHFDAEEMQRLGAREIRLFVSRDRGRNWQQTQAVAPDAGKFNFQAPTDGEYWFLVRTVDARNKLHPDNTVNDPGLQVIVDTAQPKLQLELRQPAPGRVQLSWTAGDEHLDTTQLRLEYMQPGLSDWQTVSIVPKAIGQTEWAIPQGGIVAVRGSISDFARNVAQDQVQLRVAAGNQAVPRPDAPDLRQPVASPGRSGNDSVALTMPDQFPSGGIDKSKAPPVPVAGGEDIKFTPIPMQGKDGSAPRSNFISHQGEKPIIAGQRSVTTPPDEPVRQVSTGRHRVVNTRQFQIGYKLQDVGPSGVSNVELYITQDNGATWYRYGEDPDRQSPAQVEVPKEGLYGFALGVKSGAGLASDPPQNGDRPSIIVVVDQTPPRIEMLPLEQGQGKAATKLLIPWKYADDNPNDKPIAISYSANGQAPWQPISGWIENTGSYIWNVGPGVPMKFYLRIEARDSAGNIQSVETPQPVLIDLSKPTAKIIDIETPSITIGPQ